VSIEQTTVAEINAQTVAAHLTEPTRNYLAAVDYSVNADLADQARKASHNQVVGPEASEAAANFEFIRKAVDLLPKATPYRPENLSNDTLYMLQCENPSTALMLLRNIFWARPGQSYNFTKPDGKPTINGDPVGTETVLPFYNIGGGFAVPAIEGDKTVYRMHINSKTPKESKLFGKVTRDERKDLQRIRNEASGEFVLTPDYASPQLTGNWAAVAPYVMDDAMYGEALAKKSHERNGISGKDMADGGISSRLMTLARCFEKSDEFAKLTTEWKHNLPSQKEGSEADPLVLAQLAGQLGIEGVVASERVTEPDHTIDLTK